MPIMLPSQRPSRIPRWLTIAYSAFMAVLIPVYWQNYGPRNFLYFCDVALILTLVGIWIQSPLLISMQAIAIIIPQVFWVVDFAAHAFLEHGLTGVTDYMFDATRSPFLRGLSLFHGWMPFLLLYLVWRLGYDRRALVLQTILGTSVLLYCYFFTLAPPAPPDRPHEAVNVNYVFGPSDARGQQWMPPWMWLGMLVVAFPVVVYYPTHWLLNHLMGASSRDRRSDGLIAADPA